MTGHASFVAVPGPETIPGLPFLPTYIPHDVDVTAIEDQLAQTGISAPPSLVPELRQVIDQAHDAGINLKIVVLDHNPPNDTPLRDIATVVGANYSTVTVLVMSPSYVGTYSTQFPRVTLEAGEDISKTGQPVQSAHNFVGELSAPEFCWTGFTVVLLIVVFAAAVVARFAQLCARRSAKVPAGSLSSEPDR
ncbi:MAG: hypothetical protein K2Q25_11390 [Mycobacteriaceae bacterium]|nr:hypothetical protein [Mycobacteriaceae bacterium]